MKKLVSLLLILCLALGLGLASANADEEIRLKFLISTSTADFEKDHGWSVVQEKAGFPIDFEIINGTEQLMSIISTQQPYDYVYLSGANFKLMMENDALLEIGDLIDEYGPNIKESITTLWPAVTVDGEIYAIPSTAAQPDSLRNSITARQDLLNKIGWTADKLPKTLDEFTQMLRDIKAAYPDMVPLALANDTKPVALISNVASAFGINAGGNQGAYQLIDGTITYIIDHPNLKPYLEYMRGLYDEGLLDYDWAAQKLADARNKWIGGQAVMVYNSWNGFAIDTMYELYEDMDFSVLPLLEDENGKVHAQTYSGVGAYGGIPYTAEHPAEAIQAINNLMEWDTHRLIGLGVEGVHWEYDENGNFKAIQPAFSEEKNISNVFIAGFYREDIYPTYWEVRLQKNVYMQRCFYDQKASLLDGGERSPIAIAPSTGVENQSALEKRVDDALLAYVNGGEMAKVDEAYEYWHKNGGEDVIEFYNTWYAENMK